MHIRDNQTAPSWGLDILFLAIILGGLFFIFLGGRPLFVPDEGRYAEIAREMVSSGNYVTPYLNEIKYFEKPPLFYWLEAGVIHLTGLSIWSLRSVNALLGLLGCILTYCTARKLYDRTTGLLAAFILATSALYFVMTHMISLDLPVTVFMAATLYAFLLGTQAPFGNTRRFYIWSASIAAASAVLTKGLIGLIFPGMIISAWIGLTGEWRLLKRLYLPSSIVIFLLVAAPWHILVGLRNPEFFYFYFIKQHFLRYTTLKIGHYQPAWFFIPNLILGFFPWSVFLPQTLFKILPTTRKKIQENKIELFFLLWTVLIFIFFSFSKSKLIPYILPIFPPLAILTAHYLNSMIKTSAQSSIKISYACLSIFSLLIASALFIFPHKIAVPYPQAAKFYLISAAVILIIGMFCACFYTYSNRIYNAIKITIATTAIFLIFLIAAFPAIDTRTIKPLAEIIKPLLTREDEVIAYNQYYQDLPFYLERRVSILNWKNELRLGMEHQDTTSWMLDDASFWQKWNSKRRVFAIMGNKSYKQFQKDHPYAQSHLLGTTLTNVLICNEKI